MAGPVGYEVTGPNGERGWWDGKKVTLLDKSGLPAPASKSTLAGAESRTRLALGLDPSIRAQQNLYKEEGWTGDKPANPLNSLRGAVADFIDGDDNNASALSKFVGGQKYQNYNQAAKTFESAFLPILSGAAVSPSEAQRMIRASLPQRGDSPETLARKAQNRAEMINGAAELSGRPVPFGRMKNRRAAQPAAKPGAPKAGMVEDGYRFKGGNPADPKSWEPVQ